MDCTATFLPYDQTGYFSKIVSDYIKQEPAVQPFYMHPVSIGGMKASIRNRKNFVTNRSLLVTVLQTQYELTGSSEQVQRNIGLLQNENTFTICTAHQPNIFTGPLYFVYKILHVIRLAEEMKIQMPENNFVPVYYMGSEDADLEELGHIYIYGERYEWRTNQTGAVGRMKVDEDLLALLEKMSGQLLIYPHGADIIALMKECYTKGVAIEKATFRLVNKLFADFGLVIVLPDNAALKASFAPVIEKELTEEFSHLVVAETVAVFPPAYKAQASGRELNMFYLKDDKRERIELENQEWKVLNTDLKFTREGILAELEQHPERFSPNVILRPVFQEWILPNIAFVGGGGEIAYWLQLKKVFQSVAVPYPVLLLRNSFMLINKEVQGDIDKLNFTQEALFQNEFELFNKMTKDYPA